MLRRNACSELPSSAIAARFLVCLGRRRHRIDRMHARFSRERGRLGQDHGRLAFERADFENLAGGRWAGGNKGEKPHLVGREVAFHGRDFGQQFRHKRIKIGGQSFHDCYRRLQEEPADRVLYRNRETQSTRAAIALYSRLLWGQRVAFTTRTLNASRAGHT